MSISRETSDQPTPGSATTDDFESEPAGPDTGRTGDGLIACAIVRALDVSIALMLLVLAAPVLVIAALAIRLESPGPAIFRQRRLGQDRRAFTVYKLRTMRARADSEVHRAYVRALIDEADAPPAGGPGQPVYKLTSDDRVTRVGHFLRRSSLDELPQLVNVLIGDMSIVGPRPVIAYETEQYPNSFHRRFQVKPGMTGLWQVSGRSRRTYREMIALDIEWVERQSIGLYVSIVARTPGALLRRGNAA